jgi:hypothetical protein
LKAESLVERAHVVVLCLARIHMERRPAAVRSKLCLDDRERPAGLVVRRLDPVGVAEERGGFTLPAGGR